MTYGFNSISKESCPAPFAALMGKYVQDSQHVVDVMKKYPHLNTAQQNEISRKQVPSNPIEKDIIDATSPRDPAVHAAKLKEDPIFAAVQQRRAQTEGKIGNLKNDFLGGIPRIKGYKNRAAAVNWAVLAHNLRKLARQLLGYLDSDGTLVELTQLALCRRRRAVPTRHCSN